MRKILTFGTGVLLLGSSITPGFGQQRQYPVALKVLETRAISYKADGSRTTTTCTITSPDNVSCDSTTVRAAEHTDLVSFADLSDGRLYMISCVFGAGRRFLSGAGQAMAANAGVATVSGCAVPPGVYKARWDKSRLRVLDEKNGKEREVTFVVLASAAMPQKEAATGTSQASMATTTLTLSSTPPGSDIEMDGTFVGQTPSTIPALPGEHQITIKRDGYEVWNRKITTSGGQVTIAADLIRKPK